MGGCVMVGVGPGVVGVGPDAGVGLGVVGVGPVGSGVVGVGAAGVGAAGVGDVGEPLNKSAIRSRKM